MALQHRRISSKKNVADRLGGPRETRYQRRLRQMSDDRDVGSMEFGGYRSWGNAPAPRGGANPHVSGFKPKKLCPVGVCGTPPNCHPCDDDGMTGMTSISRYHRSRSHAYGGYDGDGNYAGAAEYDGNGLAYGGYDDLSYDDDGYLTAYGGYEYTGLMAPIGWLRNAWGWLIGDDDAEAVEAEK
jgi:hypothetical protein